MMVFVFVSLETKRKKKKEKTPRDPFLLHIHFIVSFRKKVDRVR